MLCADVLQLGDGLGGPAVAEGGGAGDEHVRAVVEQLARIRCGDAAVDFEPGRAAVAVEECPDFGGTGEGARDEGLAPKPRIHRHQAHEVDPVHYIL